MLKVLQQRLLSVSTFFQVHTSFLPLSHLHHNTDKDLYPLYRGMAQYLLPALPFPQCKECFRQNAFVCGSSSAPKELFQAIFLQQGNIFCLTKGDNSASVQKQKWRLRVISTETISLKLFFIFHQRHRKKPCAL